MDVALLLTASAAVATSYLAMDQYIQALRARRRVKTLEKTMKSWYAIREQRSWTEADQWVKSVDEVNKDGRRD